MCTLNSLESVSEKLNAKYSGIKDFKTYVSRDTIRGGFDEMTYYDRLGGNGYTSYYFHETFGRISPTHGVNTYQELFYYLDDRIQRQLKWQKKNDEDYSKQYEKPLVYSHDYSLIENA